MRSDAQTAKRRTGFGTGARCDAGRASARLAVCEDGGPLRALDLAGLHALRADVRLADMTLFVLDRHLLNVGTEPAVRHAVRVADVAPCARRFTANFTNLRHRSSLHVRWFLIGKGR